MKFLTTNGTKFDSITMEAPIFISTLPFTTQTPFSSPLASSLQVSLVQTAQLGQSSLISTTPFLKAMKTPTTIAVAPMEIP